MTNYDLICIGGGSGGIAAANRAAEYGAKVAVIEGKRVGGTCVNVGCVPKKASWYASNLMEAMNYYGPGYGFKVGDLSFDYAAFVEARDAYIDRSRQSYFSRFEANGIDLIEGYGRFVDEQTVEVNGQRYQAKHFIIATGGHAAFPEVKGIDLTEDSDAFFAWQDLPESVAVVGAGYIAVELAGVLHSLGVQSHLCVRYDRPLRKFDEMLSSSLVEAMGDNGPTLRPHTSFDEYRRKGDKIECLMDGEVILTVDRVIMAIGRQPNTANLGLDQAGVELTDSGHIQVDDHHQTSQAGIYAIGDVIGKIDLTPVAIRAGRQLSEYLFNQAPTASISYDNVPTVVFSHPPIGTIGLTEAEAVDRYGVDNLTIYRSNFIAMYASVSGHREPCRFKLICQGPDQKVVGLHGIGHGVDEMIQGFGVAMKMGATKEDFDSVVAIHPTGSEEFVTMR